ncbi:MAG: ABC transporter ATP-binding protein/permease [Rhizobiaceae bacterium]
MAAVDTSGDERSDRVGETNFSEQLLMMWRALMASPLRNTIAGLLGGIFLVIVAIAFGTVLLNRWNQPFYDALERRSVDDFLRQLLVFAQIAGALLLMNVLQTWLNQTLHLKLREGLTIDLVGEWMKPRRAFRLASAGSIGVNPDQRLHEDARHLSDLSADLGIGLMQSTVLLVSFVGVLWGISSGFVFHVGGRSFAIPGYMVWAAFLYAGVASSISWLAGRPLIRLQSERYAREAEFRFSLMRVNEHVDAISLAGGEQDERRRLELDLGSVMDAARQIVRAVVRLTWFTAGYGWVTVVAPIVIASPVYFAGDLSFGGLMMAAAAFTQVHASLRWFVDNIGGIADWRATLLRVASFRSALLKLDTLHDVEQRIAFDTADDERMVLEDIAVASQEGCTRLSEDRVEVRPGEHVLFSGRPGSGKTLFFRAVAGLWPWGKGRILLPKGQTITFIPAMPYVPPGTLREALTYPRGAQEFTEAALTEALEAVGLEKLSGRLSRVGRWERELTADDLRLLSFARLILHKPRWVVIDEALDMLRGNARAQVIAALARAVPDAAIVNIGLLNGEFFTRTVKLCVDSQRPALKPAPAA